LRRNVNSLSQLNFLAFCVAKQLDGRQQKQLE